MISIKNISKKYKSDYVLRNINIDFEKHETVVCIGASGSGKSTLLKCIKGLEPVTDGSIYVNKTKLTKRNSRKLCSKIGMVFQQFNLFKHMNVLDNLIYSPINVKNMPKIKAIEKANLLLRQFGIEDKAFSMTEKLSGGQKQRVAIARALMMDPELMLFDEPTSALDPEVIKDIIEIISMLKSKMKMLVITHHIKFAKVIADRILFMDNGLILADQPANDFFVKPSSHRARLFLKNVGDLL